MYRPHKKQLVRRVSVTGALVLVAVTGLAVTFISQGASSSSALTPAKTVASTSSSEASTTSASASTAISTPAYHVVRVGGDDGGNQGDN